MRILFFISILLRVTGLFAQNSDNLGIDNSPILNVDEVNLLNSLLKEERDTFDFTKKKVAFISGSTGQSIVAKSDYFKNNVNPWIEDGSQPQIFMVILTEDEKKKSGGYDVLVLSWVKLFTRKRQKKVITQLGTIK